MDKMMIDGRAVGGDAPCYVIAEMSANHNHSYDEAAEIIQRAKEAGVDAIKIQTYTADTITMDSDKADFQITQGTIWDGTTLYKLYQEAYTPWDWQPKLMALAKREGITLFSSPFDLTAVDFLEEMAVPAYKIASFELNDIPLIKKAAATGKPMIMSTGVSGLAEIEEAVAACRAEQNNDIILLKCTSAYPAPMAEMNLRTIPNMAQTFGCVAGLSDHTLGHTAVLGAVALGAKVVEKHITLERARGGVDASFSMEPAEFREMIAAIRDLEAALGTVTYALSEKQKNSKEHSRSLYVVKDMAVGEEFTPENLRSIRPAFGLHTRHYAEVLGKKARMPIEKGTRMDWTLLE